MVKMIRYSLMIILVFCISVVAATEHICSAIESEDGVEKKPVLYVFAHQDDEALIIAKIATDLHNGREVYCIWITDGSGTASPQLREEESRNVMKHTGVPQENLFFLGYEDRYSWKFMNEVLADVDRIAREIKPVEITSNAYEGGNIDHDVSSLITTIVSASMEPPAIHYEYPLYNVYNGAYRVGKFIPYPDSETLYTPINKYLYNLKNDVLDLYPTQAAIIRTLKSIIDKKALKKNGEPYRIAPKYDYTKRPVDEALGYEANARNPTSFEDWHSAVVPFLDGLGE